MKIPKILSDLLLFFIILCLVTVGVVVLSSKSRTAAPDYVLGTKPLENGSFEIEVWSTSSIDPCGNVILFEEPKRIVTLNHNHNDILETFGYGDRVIGTGFNKSFYYSFYKQLPGFNWEVRKENGNLKYFVRGAVGLFDKELFYAMDPDIIHIDPYRLSRWGNGWSMDDVKEISENIAPFFDNNASIHGDDYLSHKWGDLYDQNGDKYYSYEEYTMAFYKLYNQEEKGKKILDFTHELENRLVEKIHTVNYRPRLALFRWKETSITRVGINSGIEHHQYNVLEAQDAFRVDGQKIYDTVLPKSKDKSSLAGHLDLEGLLSVDPDVIIMPYIIYTFENDNHVMTPPWELLMSIKDDPIGKRISAVKNNRIYPGGVLFQGPIFYIFQLEMAAKQLYPELFGEYNTSNEYPPEEQLFSREELARIILE